MTADKTPVLRVVLCIVNHDRLGNDEIIRSLEDAHYPNRCIYPSVESIEHRLIDYTDDHPINSAEKSSAEFERLFAKDETVSNMPGYETLTETTTTTETTVEIGEVGKIASPETLEAINKAVGALAAVGDPYREPGDLFDHFDDAVKTRIDDIIGAASKADYATKAVLQHFTYAHLKRLDMRELSRTFAAQALVIYDNCPANPDRTTALRDLLAAKDCAVRALNYRI